MAKAKAEPALVFTIPEQPSDLDDGLLQASEIAELNGHGADLSVCPLMTLNGYWEVGPHRFLNKHADTASE